MLQQLLADIERQRNPDKALILSRFFKTGKGEYGEGDIFYGLTVPQSRVLVKKYIELSISDITQLVTSEVHEKRLIALLLLVAKFEKGTATQKKEIFNTYLLHTKYINNWDLIDLTAPKIVGAYLYSKLSEEKYIDNLLRTLAMSSSLWEKRIAMMATFYFIMNGKKEQTFNVADILLHDTHDLIHKSVGWMLREVGKRISQEDEEIYLKDRYKTMPRTTLRYAIERFDKRLQQKYLHGLI